MKYRENLIKDIDEKLSKSSCWANYTVEELRLELAESMLKIQCGYSVSYTQNELVKDCRVMRKDGSPNKDGRFFLLVMFCNHSNLRPLAYKAMTVFRNEPKENEK